MSEALFMQLFIDQLTENVITPLHYSSVRIRIPHQFLIEWVKMRLFS